MYVPIKVMQAMINITVTRRGISSVRIRRKSPVIFDQPLIMMLTESDLRMGCRFFGSVSQLRATVAYGSIVIESREHRLSWTRPIAVVTPRQ